MATEGGFVVDESFEAGSGGATQYAFARTTGGNIATLCTSATGGGASAFGVFQDAASSGNATAVRHIGRTKLKAGGSITAGDLLASTTAGLAVTVSTTGEFVKARAINGASTAASQVIDAYLIPGYVFMGSTA